MRWSAWLYENDFNSMKRYSSGKCCINVNNQKWTREQGETGVGCPKRLSSRSHVCKLCQSTFILNFQHKLNNQHWLSRWFTTKSVTRSFASLVQGKVAMIPTNLIPPEAFPLLQEIMLRRCGWAGWIPFIAAMRWMCIKWRLNGSKTQMTYESYDINPVSGSDSDKLVWPLGPSAWMRRVEHCGMNETWSKTFLWKPTWSLQDVTPPCVFCTM